MGRPPEGIRLVNYVIRRALTGKLGGTATFLVERCLEIGACVPARQPATRGKLAGRRPRSALARPRPCLGRGFTAIRGGMKEWWGASTQAPGDMGLAFPEYSFTLTEWCERILPRPAGET